jgi:hypothetical protein
MEQSIMRTFRTLAFAGMLAAAPVCLAQGWYAGVSGGLGYSTNLTVTNPSGNATAGFKPGPVVGATLGQEMYEHLAGEFHYLYRFSTMKLESGGTKVDFSGRSHSFHYDLLFLGGKRTSAVRPFLAVGGGVRVYQGTGKEVEFQPLMDLAVLTHTRETKGLASVGGGIKWSIGRRGFLRLEARDYITPTPKVVIAPVPPSKISGWIHDITPMVTLGFSF